MSPQTATIVVDQDAAQLLQALQAKARMQGVTLGALLRPLAENGVTPKGEKPLHETAAPAELAQAFPGIEKTPGVCGGSACLANTRMPVWLLAQARRGGVSEADLLLDYPALRAEDLVNAWAYVSTHQAEIEEDIRQNETDEVIDEEG